MVLFIVGGSVKAYYLMISEKWQPKICFGLGAEEVGLSKGFSTVDDVRSGYFLCTQPEELPKNTAITEATMFPNDEGMYLGVHQ